MNTVDKRIRDRLGQLEAELLSLRRELGESPSLAQLPKGSFGALQVVVGSDVYGVPIERVREIVRYVQLTRITDVPSVVAGAINVRGEIYPVIDARVRFGYPTQKPTQRTSIVLTEQEGRLSGLIVDSVIDVVTITPESISEPKGALAQANCVLALSTVRDALVQLVDLSRLLSVREWGSVLNAISEHPVSNTDDARSKGEAE